MRAVVGGFPWEVRSGAVQILKDTIRSIGPFIAMPGRILAVTNVGLATFQEGRTRRIDTIEGGPFRDAAGLFQDSRGVIWVPYTSWDGIGRSARILRIDGADTTVHETPLGYGTSLSGIVEDGDGEDAAGGVRRVLPPSERN